MINDSAKAPLSDDVNPQKATVTLVEPKKPNSNVTICGLPKNAIVIKVDDFFSVERIFSGSKNECKRSDYVIIAENNGKKHVLYIELKSTSDLEHKIIDQLKGSVCFIDYCRSIAKWFWEKDNFLNGYKHRFVSLRHINTRKKKTRIINQERRINDSPSRFLKISSPNNLNYKMLVDV